MVYGKSDDDGEVCGKGVMMVVWCVEGVILKRYGDMGNDGGVVYGHGDA